jgi:DNA-binding CsgD family transcriptional regulator
MHEGERLSRLIGDIYDAALNPALWRDALRKTARFVHGSAAGLLSKDAVSKVGDAHYHVGVDEHYIRLYRETHWKFDPLSPLLFFDVARVTSRSECVPDDEFFQSRFYREWVEPQGWIDAANVVLEKSGTSCSIFSVIRSRADGTVDDRMRRCMDIVVPHMCRAVLIGRAIDLKRAEAATFADALDDLPAGMFLIGKDARIKHANAAGQAMLEAGDILRSTGGRLFASDRRADEALREVFVAAVDGDTALGVKGVAVPLIAENGKRHVAHALPLTAGARRQTGETYAATAALFVRGATLDSPPALEVIARRYQLTPTELRVLLAIVEVGGTPKVAEALGVSPSTVRTHLKSLFSKTGTRRQADLVKLVAAHQSPFAA